MVMNCALQEKVSNQIWADELIDFSLLLKRNISNTDDDQYTIKFETKKGGTAFSGTCSKCEEQYSDQWTSAFEIYVAIYTERAPQDTPTLMKYSSVIRELATLGANWRFMMRTFVNFGNPRVPHGIKFIQSSFLSRQAH